jgi:TfoX/Sxy family transcriptional regulator of competence genes
VAYNEDLAGEIRIRIGSHPGLTEKEMFGGVAFMIRGNMAVGVSGDELMVRVGKEAHEEALAQPGTRPFDMTGRPMAGWVLVSPDELADEDVLDRWVSQGVDHAETLPEK